MIHSYAEMTNKKRFINIIKILVVNTFISEFLFFLDNLNFNSQKIDIKILYWLIIYINIDN